MKMTRKDFLGAAAGSTALLFLQACGGGGGDYGGSPAPAPGPAPAPSPSPSQTCGSSGSAIAGNHGHVLSIPAADLDATTSMTYDMTGAAGHAHSVTFTPAQLQMLKAGQSVIVTSTTTLQHSHVVTATCS